MNPLRSNKGLTLVEIIMTIVIVGIISIIVGPILIQGFNSFFASAGVTDMDAQGKLAMERMSRDIRGITSPAADIHSSSNATVFRFSLGGNTVRFRRDAPNQAIMRDTLFFILWDSDLLCGLVTNLTTFLDRSREIQRESEKIIELVHMNDVRDAFASELSYGKQRQLELALTQALDPVLMMLDEPTAGLDAEETREFVQLIKQVTRGKTLLVVEHDMDVVFDIADRITVLNYGRILVTGTPDEILANEKVRNAYLGRK